MAIARRARGQGLRQFKVWLTPGLYERITSYCEKENVSKSSIVENTLDMAIPKVRKKRKLKRKKKV